MNTFKQAAHDFTRQLTALTRQFEARVVQLAESEAVHATHPDKLAALAERLGEQRRLRKKYLPIDLFHEPGWDMLLALFVAAHQNRTLNVKALVGTSDAPVTTSQRWIEHLYRLGLVNRVVDPADRRRIEVSLSEAGIRAMTSYLGAVCLR